MALLLYTDVEQQLNVTLTDPEGQATVNTLIAAAVSWAESRCGYAFEQAEHIDLFDGGQSLYFLKTAAPIDTAEDTTVESYNPNTHVYDAFAGTVRASENGQVQIDSCINEGFLAVRITYTAGWTDETFPADLKQALVELVARKFNAAQSGDQQLKRVTSGAYTEEFATSTDTKLNDVPGDIQEVVDRYRRVFVA